MHITGYMYIPGRETHITWNCSWVGKIHSTRDMCQGEHRYYEQTDVTVMSQ